MKVAHNFFFLANFDINVFNLWVSQPASYFHSINYYSRHTGKVAYEVDPLIRKIPRLKFLPMRVPISFGPLITMAWCASCKCRRRPSDMYGSC